MQSATDGAGAHPKLVLFDDGRGEFGPLLDLRPSFALLTGAVTTRTRLERTHGRAVTARVPQQLSGIIAEADPPAERLASALGTLLGAGDSFLVVNGRRAHNDPVPSLAIGEALTSGDAIVAARLDRAGTELFLRTGALPSSIRAHATEAPLLESPWDLLRDLGASIAADIGAMLPTAESCGFALLPEPHPTRMGSHPVLVHHTASVAPQVVFDATIGPVVVGAKCVVRPFSVICGPASIGESSIVADRSLIKSNVACGPQCRLGGEVGGTSIAGRSNKAHDGHLGDSVVGEWVNLGAGTDNSNLLNTYGDVPVRLEPNGPRTTTGRTFFGAVIGDHVKTAIGTRIMTGTVLGTGAMIASTAAPPLTVRRFAWITDAGERRYALPKFLAVAQVVMARRGVALSAAMLERLTELHAAGER